MKTCDVVDIKCRRAIMIPSLDLVPPTSLCEERLEDIDLQSVNPSNVSLAHEITNGNADVHSHRRNTYHLEDGVPE